MALTSSRHEPVSILQRQTALRPDLILVVALLALSSLGVLAVYTASAQRLSEIGGGSTDLMRRQALFAVIGLAGFAVASALSSRTLRTLAPLVYVLSMISLVAVLFAPERANANRWIPIWRFQLQPSEFAKVAVILALALLVANARGKLTLAHVFRAALIVAAPAVLIFMQPDLGTMLVFGFIAISMLAVGGVSWRQFAFLVIAGLVGAVGLLQVGALKAYQISRVTAWLDPSSDLAATALYNQQQSEIAIGSGGLFGKGLLEGTQTNLSFVPEQATDFIFTAIGEQLGFFGASIVLGLYAVIIWRVLVAAAVGRDTLSRMVAVGVAAMLVFHVFVNVGMTLSLMPVTGLPLPFVSAGGSSFIAMAIALGLAHSVWMRRSPVKE